MEHTAAGQRLCPPRDGAMLALMAPYGIYAIVLLLVGLVILVCEVFTPSGGLLAITTTIVLVLSAICAYVAWFDKAPIAWWIYVTMLVLLVPTTLFGTLYMLPKTSMGKQVLLEGPELSRLEPFANESAHLATLVGKRGVTLTLLNPGGMVLVAGERLHAFSEGLLLDPQTPIEILEIRGTRALVKPVENASEEEVAGAPASETIDFDVPAE